MVTFSIQGVEENYVFKLYSFAIYWPLGLFSMDKSVSFPHLVQNAMPLLSQIVHYELSCSLVCVNNHVNIFFLQYKGAHVKPGFAEHFYSNPARYKGRDNMFVS